MHVLLSISFIILAAGRAFLCHAQSEPVEYLGCWTDASDRIFASRVRHGGGVSIDSCAQDCSGSAYMGVQNGNECWCGTLVEDYTRHGASQQCSKACSGNSSQICGGGWAMGVYRLGYVYGQNMADLGCYSDSLSNDRALTDQVSVSSLTVEDCYRGCLDRGFGFMGVSRGSECWCGNNNNYGRHGSATTCNSRTCSGDSSQFCGGSDSIRVYDLGQPLTAFPTGAPAPNPGVNSCSEWRLNSQVFGPIHVDGGIHFVNGVTQGECCELCQNLPDCVVAEYDFAACNPIAGFSGIGGHHRRMVLFPWRSTPAVTNAPTPIATDAPTPQPTAMPTLVPTPSPSPRPTSRPTPVPTDVPSPRPTSSPTAQPSPAPSPTPTQFPTLAPIPVPTSMPTPQPTPAPCPIIDVCASDRTERLEILVEQLLARIDALEARG